jgi:signal transduction histidine kinase
MITFTQQRNNIFRQTVILSLLILSLLWPNMGKATEIRLIVGIYNNPPKIFLDDQNQPAGIFIDILNNIAWAEGWELGFRYGSWADCMEWLEEGSIDLMPDVAYTAARSYRFNFNTEPALSSWFQIYASPKVEIKSILDLGSKKVAVLQESVQESAFRQYAKSYDIHFDIYSGSDYEQLFEAVRDGFADAVVANSFFGQLNAGKYGLYDTAIIFHPTQLYFAAPLGRHEAILGRLDHHLLEMKSNKFSAYYQSIRKWTSLKPDFVMPDWIKIFFSALLMILIISLAGSYLLKMQVDRRTKELQIINREMEQRIIERTAQLDQAMRRAQEADRIKSAFLATMSHELRTPLNSIIGFTGIILQRLAGPINEEQEKQLQMVQNSSRHLLALINDILDISKIEAGQLSLSKSKFDLKQSLQKTASLIKPIADRKKLELRLLLPEAEKTICTDQRRFEQIIINLLNNAIKFTDQGHIELKCIVANDTLSITVSDTGIGIESSDMEKLFQPFHQIDSGLTRKREGTGLGLNITRKLLDMMGGNISVKSTPDKGSDFTITLPGKEVFGNV